MDIVCLGPVFRTCSGRECSATSCDHVSPVLNDRRSFVDLYHRNRGLKVHVVLSKIFSRAKDSDMCFGGCNGCNLARKTCEDSDSPCEG